MRPTSLMNLNYAKLLMLMLSMFIVVSCKDDDDDDKKNTDYIGTWSRTETMVIGEFELQLRDVMIFTENKVTNMGQAWNPEIEDWVDLLAMDADIDVNRNSMDVTVTDVAVSDVDDLGNPTGELLYFSEDDEGFEEVLAELELEQHFMAKYSVSGNELTLSMDDNGDGDFNDEGETQVYFRD